MDPNKANVNFLSEATESREEDLLAVKLYGIHTTSRLVYVSVFSSEFNSKSNSLRFYLKCSYCKRVRRVAIVRHFWYRYDL